MHDGSSPLWLQSALKGAPLAFLALALCMNGCAMFSGNGPNVSPPPAPPAPPRSEMVLLNVSEASGWVAYACDPDAGEETETYRIVVIRQTSGEIIYDSQVPLTANLCTHGFEMAPTDPRLEQLARNVDRNIIAPLEAYGKPDAREPTRRPEPPTSREAESSGNEQDSDEVGPAGNENAAKSAPGEESEPGPAETLSIPGELEGVRIVGAERDQVTLRQEKEGLLASGRRFFLRHPPKVIALPGYEPDSIVSKGEVAGLIEITQVDGMDAAARLLSGEAPANGYLEPVRDE